MATVEDYLGKRFGEFTIVALVNNNEDIVTFSCFNEETRFFYVLRLSLSEKDLWKAEPLLPPINYKLEIENVIAARIIAPEYYSKSFEEESYLNKLFSNKNKKRKDWVFDLPDIYGVIQNKYLIPLSSPVRVKLSWDIDKLLNVPIEFNVHSYFQLWEDVISSMVVDYYNISKDNFNEWEEKWGKIYGGDVMKDSVSEFIDNGDMSDIKKLRINNIFSKSKKGQIPLAENLLFILCACMEKGEITPDEVKATLMCKHFRLNLSIFEINQIIALYNNFIKTEFSPPENSIVFLKIILLLLQKEPFDKFVNNQEFEIRNPLPDYNVYKLIILEDVQLKQEVITLKAPK